jgi:uncharacterized protein
MSHDNIRPNAHFNDEDSNTSNNPAFDSVLSARLSRRSLLGGAGAAALGGTALTGCATSGPVAPVSGLGFKPVVKTMADQVTVPEGYTARVIYALGDPLTGRRPASTRAACWP